MAVESKKNGLARDVKEFVLRGFKPRYGELEFPSHPVWRRMRELGCELWLDTGSIEDAIKLWTREFTALTTNNTLLNKEVQTGRYDGLIREARELLAAHPELSERDLRLEYAFILNAWHGLRLVEKFDAYVSVEEHTDLASDLDGAARYARRYHEICPKRFIVKVPFTPAGLLATRRVAAEGIPVNHTLGFSARQNYVIARLSKPRYVNVFLGRLNSFVADNKLGDGKLVGERAALASQREVRKLRRGGGVPTKQIGASFRAGEQVRDLVGLDVFTIPPKVAEEFLKLGIKPSDVADRTGEDYRPGLNPGVDAKTAGLDTLWDVGEKIVACVDAVEKATLDKLTPGELVTFFAEHGCGDLLVPWADAQIETSMKEGKIPRLENWRGPLASGRIGLDSLLNLAGLNSFTADQKAMDERVKSVLAKA